MRQIHQIHWIRRIRRVRQVRRIRRIRVLKIARYCTGNSTLLKFWTFLSRNWQAIFANNSHPKSFVDFCIKKYLDKVFIKKKVALKASKKELICVLPFLGKKSMQLRTRLVNSIENNLKFCKLKVIFQSPCKLNSLFRYKDSLSIWPSTRMQLFGRLWSFWYSSLWRKQIQTSY